MVSRDDRDAAGNHADAPDPRIRAEAAVWIARMHSESRTIEDDDGFRAWLAMDTAHRHVFDRMTLTWDVAGALSPYQAGVAAKAVRRPTRRGVIAGMATGLLAGGGFGIWNMAYAGVYETGKGERREIPLDDGSQLMLDTETRVRVSIGARERRLALYRGRLGLQVATDTARPFRIVAADRVIAADSGRVDVRLEGDMVAAAVIEGKARFGMDRSPAASRPIGAGQRLIAREAAAALDMPDIRQLTAWQNGQAIFDGDSLAKAVAEMNRYSEVQIAVSDPAVAELRISGVYLTGDNQAFADSVAAALPVRVARNGGRIMIVSSGG